MLEDHASTTMGHIATKAAALDAALKGLDDRLGVLDNSHDNMATNWERRSKRMSREFRQDINGMRAEMTGLNTFMGGFDRKKVIKVDADTTRAIAKIRAVHELAQRNATMGLNSRGGFARAVGGGFGRMSQRMDRRAARTDNRFLSATTAGLSRVLSMGEAASGALDRIGVNLGPISARLSTLPMIFGALGGPLMGAAATGVSVLTGAVSALGAAALGAVGIVGALGMGIGSIAVPAMLAGKRIATAQKEVVKAQKALDKAKVGTKSYTNAQKRLAAAQSALSETDKTLIKNTGKLRDAWNKQVMQGKSGQRVVSMMNQAVLFGAKQMPWVASMFDRFTASGDRLFKLANRNAPRFKRLMFDATDTWPARFEEGGKSAGHLTAGLLGVLDAAEPFTEWLSQGLLAKMEQFDKWANGSGKKGIAGWLNDMKPILGALGRMGGALGGSIIELSRRDADDIVYFMDQITEGIKKLPGFVDKWTDRFRKLWPVIREGFGELGDFLDFTWRGMEDIADSRAFGILKRGLFAIRDAIKAIQDILPGGEGIELLIMGAVATKGGRKGTAWMLRNLGKSIGFVATNLGKIPLGKTRSLAGLLSKIPGAARAGGILGSLGRGAGRAAGPVDSIVSMFEVGMPVSIVGNSPINPVWVAIAGSINLPFTKMGGRLAPKGGAGAGRGAGVGRAAEGPARTSGAARRIPGANDGVTEGRVATRNGKLVMADEIGSGARGGLLGRGAKGALTKTNIILMAAAILADPDSAGAGESAILYNQKLASGRFSTNFGDPAQRGPNLEKTHWYTSPFSDAKWRNHEARSLFNRRFYGANADSETANGRMGQVDKIASGMTPGGQDFLRSMMPKGDWAFAKFIRSKGGPKLAQNVKNAVDVAMNGGVGRLNVGGVKMFLAYNAQLDRIETRRIDLSGFFSDMWQKFKDGVAALGGIVQSVTGPLNTFWGALTGNGAAPTATPGTPTSGPTAQQRKGTGRGAIGDSKKGSGIVARAKGAVGGFLGKGANLVKRAVGWLAGKGTAGKKTASGIQTMQDALMQQMGGMFSSGGAVSANGLLPQAANLAAMMAKMFGVTLTSGFRPGAITESGNLSLHALGRAVDLGGSAAQMNAVWNYLLGKPGINEIIHNGMIAENGGPPVPYTGADKHYDHVHVGIGDSSKGSGIRAVQKARARGGSVKVSMAGAVIHIHTEADYEAFIKRMADDIDRAVNSTGESAGEMLG